MSVSRSSERASQAEKAPTPITPTPLVEELDKNLKYDAPTPFTGKRSKFKAFIIQLNLYMTFNRTRFTSETERVLWAISRLERKALN